MAVRQKQNKKIFIETEYDNIVIVNPNEVYNSEGKNEERLVDHEDLVYYANLETFIIPRTKLAIGQSFTDPVVNTTIATIFGGEEDLKINFLKPRGKSDFDTSWSNQLTGEGSRQGVAINQNKEKVVNFEGRKTFERSVGKYEDTQLLGIKSIKVNIKGTGVPEVNIELVDIQGRSLFEQGENSLYSAFFNFPYPLFYLTLKGYYGKAVRYRLSLMSFNASFDADSGNYNISLKLIGKFTALLFDTPLAYAVNAPKMYNTQITVTEPNGNKSFFNTYKGRQKLDEVYKIYKRKGLLPETFPHLSIEDFVLKVENYKTALKSDLTKQEDFTKLNDLQDFSENLSKLNKEVYEYALSTVCDRTSYYVAGGEIYYPFRKDITFQSREDFKTKIKARIENYTNNLKNNASFGENANAKYQINTLIKNQKDIIKKLDFNIWQKNQTDVRDTYFARYNRQLSTTNSDEYRKFLSDETLTAVFETKVQDENGQWVEDTPDYLVFGDKTIGDGTYVKNSYLDRLDSMNKSLEAKQKVIEDELTKFYAQQQLKSPASGGLGFKPTIRNIFAIILAGADAFYRLMDETHTEAWNVKSNKNRLLAVIPENKNFSVDAQKALQKSSTELNSDNVVYPWPLYFTLEKQENNSELYVIQYPGDAKYIKQTNAYDYKIWPEVGFVETYIKASLEKEKPTSNYSYDNPSDVTKYVPSSTIEFPFKQAPYQDLNAIKIFYELFERSFISSHYGNIPTDAATKNQVDKFFGDIESLNLSLIAPEDITINQNLKNFKFTLNKLVEYMKQISNDGQGESWQRYIRDFYNTEYLINELKNDNEIYSIDTISSESKKISADLPLVKNVREFLKDSQTSEKNTLDTYPFTDLTWLKNNMANGESIGAYEDFNNTTNTYSFIEDKKLIGRVTTSENYSNIKLFTTNTVFNTTAQAYLSNETSESPTPINSRLSLKNYFENRKSKNLYLTESYINYGNSYSGNLGTFIQTTSLLNTPYFVNSIIDGVKKQKTFKKNPFVALGYLFLNSLPLITTKEKIKDFTDDQTLTDLDYLASSLNKFSSIHQVPYAWVLKYGSIWHRYKNYIENKIDILDDVWKDFDYKNAYDPTSGTTNRSYTVLNYDGEPFTFSLQDVNLSFPSGFPLISVPTDRLDLFNVGFYPEVINSIEYYINGKDLITGYTGSNYTGLCETKGLRIGINGEASNAYPKGFDTNNPIRSLSKNNLYVYREVPNTTGAAQDKKIILYPSTGGIPFDQSIFECFNEDNKITEDIYDNKSMYNGSVRSIWGMSNFGYYNTNLIKKPLPTEYLKVIKTNESLQNDFDLINNDATYSKIDEIFNVFDIKLLDKMEQKFLTFCSLTPNAKDLILNDESITSTYTNPGGLKNSNLKLLKGQISKIFSLQDAFFDQVDENVDGNQLGENQLVSMYSSLKEFLNFDCVLKIGNPTKYERKLFDSFSNLQQFQVTDKYTFNPYRVTNLPGDNSAVTLIDSIIKNTEAWKTLRKYLGFSTIENIDYPTQVDPAFPSYGVPTPTANTPSIQIKFIGDSSSLFTTGTTAGEYINVTKTNGQYQVYQIVGDPNINASTKVGFIKFYQPNTNIEDSTNLVPSSYENNFTTNFSFVCTIQDIVPSNYTMVVEYYPSGFTNDKIDLVANVSTSPQNTQTTTQPTNFVPIPQALPNTEKSLVADFFIDNNIDFTKTNVELLYPLIRLYVEQKRSDSSFDKNKFTTYINNYLLDRYDLQDKMVNETFSNLNIILKNIEVDDGLPKTAMNGDTTKLSLYNTLKTFNDKWIAGSDLKTVTLFEDFLFMDRANSDLGNSYTVDVEKVIKRIGLDTNQNQTLMSLISSILEDNYFIFMAMPSYINFYGIQETLKNEKPLKDSEIGNTLFGTYLEVDYTKSSPKFLCLYIGNPSEYPKPKENTFNRFGDDSFDLRVPDNPLRVSDPKGNYSLNNKVVGFAVDFGIRNQNIFKSLSLDMSEMKNTSESFQVFADMGSSVAGDKVGQQSQSLYSVYKSRSYSCGVTSMGNAMIQPTMYFILRHVPMFYGPYWITEVNHNISESGFDTDFKGTRIPKYALPKVDNLLASVNRDVLSEIKAIAAKDKKPKQPEVLESERLLSENPTITTLVSPQNQCSPEDMFKTIPFVDLVQTTFTKDEVVPLIKAVTNDVSMRSLLYGLLQVMPSTTLNDGVFNCINNNPYEINTGNVFKGNLPSLITAQSCVLINNKSKPLVKFNTLQKSIEFVNSFMLSLINMVPELVTINVDTDLNRSYGKALFQLAFTTWLTPIAFGPPQLTATEIMDKTKLAFTDKDGNILPAYNQTVEIFTQAYELFNN